MTSKIVHTKSSQLTPNINNNIGIEEISGALADELMQ